jgi:HK97 family phage major capsid protein/HK97 family phage prohead protease
VTLERLTIEVKFARGEAGLISGYASLFGRPADHVDDVVMPGAYRATLAAHKRAGTLPAMLSEHDGEPIGEWLEMEEDELGLRVKGRLDLDSESGRATYAALMAGDIDAMSIGYFAVKTGRDRDGARLLQQIDLREVSLVKSPAASRARVLSVKHHRKGNNVTTAIAKKAEGDPAETPSLDDRVAALETDVAALKSDVAAIRGSTDEASKSLKAIETKLARPNVTVKQEDEVKPERKAFASFLRKGAERMGEEVKSLVVADDTRGGYLAPPEFSAEVVKGIVEFSPIRQAAKVGSTSSGSVILPKRTGRPTASWVGEDEDRPETGSTYGQVEIPVHEMACYVDVSQRLLEDAAVNVETEVANDLAEEFGRLEGYDLLRGDGVKKPLGLMSASGIAYTPTGNASTLGSAPADLLIDFLYGLSPTYRNAGSWMMNGTTLAAIRKLKDGTTGVYLWQPAFAAGQPETILGRPVIEAPDMPDIGSGAEPIIYGDFMRAFRIYDRVAMSVLRDPYTQATRGLVRFHARRRVGAGLVLAEALRKIKCATS